MHSTAARRAAAICTMDARSSEAPPVKRTVVFGSSTLGLVISAPVASAQKTPDVRLNDLSRPECG
jgi:hypothetical protein